VGAEAQSANRQHAASFKAGVVGNSKVRVRPFDYKVRSFGDAMTREEWVAKEIAAKEAVMNLDAHNKTVLRSMLEREYNFWEREGRDYVYGQDEGEINKGNVREY
jgi:hypothetical protein